MNELEICHQICCRRYGLLWESDVVQHCPRWKLENLATSTVLKGHEVTACTNRRNFYWSADIGVHQVQQMLCTQVTRVLRTSGMLTQVVASSRRPSLKVCHVFTADSNVLVCCNTSLNCSPEPLLAFFSYSVCITHSLEYRYITTNHRPFWTGLSCFWHTSC